MIQGLFMVWRCGDAHKLFNDVLAKGHMPNQLTYGIILKGHCNNHLVEDVFSLFCLMGNSKLNSDIAVYTIIMDGASKSGKFDIARALFDDLSVKEMLLHEMDGRGYSLDVSTLSLLIDSIAAGSLETTLHNFKGKLVPKELMDASSLRGILKKRSWEEK
ncbi:tetratricopeptide-like helical domain-containing protein [Artemisia annua]|uniref:Tetratricopeptide-like helical domain-containing protein n=1 Tax=Artemisia annua TaxID=35608 RepID=A0A2U1KF29_ARTAN|nr:tetratricopeptide-like helical domain-containing protein [Artemisia annua]